MYSKQLHEHCIHILVKLAKTQRCANAFFSRAIAKRAFQLDPSSFTLQRYFERKKRKVYSPKHNNLLLDRDLGYWRSFLISYKTLMSKHSARYMLNNHLTGNLLKHTGRQKSKRSRQQEDNCCRHCASFGRSPHVLYMYTIQGVAWWGVAYILFHASPHCIGRQQAELNVKISFKDLL